jgi:hypothetical protein
MDDLGETATELPKSLSGAEVDGYRPVTETENEGKDVGFAMVE